MSSTLGKRKEREEDKTDIQTHGSTFFVSNLPYTATSVDLQTLFSDIAPVRSAFVVLEHGTGISKGVGYVSFALKEDAESAFQTISSEGIALNGRKLRVQWADSKPKEGETVKREPKARPQARAPHPRNAHDPQAIRTVVVSGLPTTIDSKTLWKKIRKYQGAEKVEWPFKPENGEEDSGTAHVLFSTSATAQEAVNKLHAHVFKGSLLSVTLKKRFDSLSKVPAVLTKSSVTATSAIAPNRASRLIVRNIPFDISEQDLRAVFLPYGPIHSIHIPKEKDGDKGKGFAFVWMLSKKDAEKALEKCNGMAVRAGMAQGLVQDKQKRKKVLREEKKRRTAVKADGERGEEEVQDAATSKATEGRVIAVDWALSKEKWQEQAKMDVDGQENEEMEDVKREDVSDDENASENSDDHENLGVHHNGSDSSDQEQSDGEDELGDEDQEPMKPQLPPPETGTTLFIRNVPFAATEDELRTLFRAFGPLRYARITLESATGRSRGTGFACFWNKEDADKVVEQSDLLRTETMGNEVQPKKNPFTLPSILTPDPSSTLAKSLVLHGRALDVTRAVTRDEAGKLKEEGEKRREKADKRNLYLLREGVILPNTPAADSLTPAEIERRTSSFNARRTLLKSNPSLFISKTRLSIRQIPIFVTERVLKRLAIHAVRAFESEVKEGTRTALTQDELTEVVEDEDDDKRQVKHADSGPGRKKTHRKAERSTGVRQAKIVRQHERVDPVTGKGRSKGYGFVEMHKHADALRVLRWTNNNPGVGPLFEQWWKDELQDMLKQENKKEDKDDARLKRVKEEMEKSGSRNSKSTLIAEFSIENVQVVQRRFALQKDKASTAEPRPSREKIILSKIKTEQPSPKKRRLSVDNTNTSSAKDGSSALNQRIGTLIGRKRKERKLGKNLKGRS